MSCPRAHGTGDGLLPLVHAARQIELRFDEQIERGSVAPTPKPAAQAGDPVLGRRDGVRIDAAGQVGVESVASSTAFSRTNSPAGMVPIRRAPLSYSLTWLCVVPMARASSACVMPALSLKPLSLFMASILRDAYTRIAMHTHAKGCATWTRTDCRRSSCWWTGPRP